MNWSPKQDDALLAVARWLQCPNGQQVFRLFGYAGTGKTTLAVHFANGCEGRVLFAAFTGKAASVMRQRGCRDASTIHRLIYTPTVKSSVRLLELREALIGTDPEEKMLRDKILAEIVALEKELKRPSFVLNLDSDLRGAKLLIIDECSMVGKEMAEDLLSFGVPILVLGDPAQLPPVRSTGYFTDAQPDRMLTEIHRQAAESPIIQLATAVREGRAIAHGTHGDSLVARWGSLGPEAVMGHDQILVGRNATRRACNTRTRALLGKEGALPTNGDRLVCLRNDHEVGVLNGEIWRVDRCDVLSSDLLSAQITNVEEGMVIDCEIHRHHFEGRELGYFEARSALEFDYGYALTTHKAQGSQWGSVIVFDESACFKNDNRRWLYTAITRAANRITIVTN